MITPAYKMDVIRLSGTTVPPIEDPAGGADPWAGITEHSFTDAEGNTLTSTYSIIGTRENDAIVRFSRDGIYWSPDIVIYSGDNPITRWFKMQKIQIRNETAGSNATIQAEIYG